jgi:hypothetical protein
VLVGCIPERVIISLAEKFRNAKLAIVVDKSTNGLGSPSGPLDAD